jgi:sugar/nucleoside kinase (ribokinase family)
MKKYDVFGIGNALVDIEFSVDDNFLEKMDVEKGLMTLVDEERQAGLIKEIDGKDKKQACGGSSANSVIAVSHFGGKSFFTCRVADDEFGRFYMDDLNYAGVDTNLNKHPMKEGVTGKCLVMVSEDAERTMNTFLGIAETVDSTDLVEEALIESKYVYVEGYLVTSPSGKQAAIDAFEIARKNGVKTSLTFSDPAMVKYFGDGVKDMVKGGIDLLFCNEEEALIWADTEDFDKAVEAIKDTAKTFAITRGKEGALLYDGENFINVDPYPVQAVDTTGAGDLFAGAFLYGITNGLDFAKAGDLASIASSTVVTRFGPRLNMMDHKELLNKILNK